jgi:hypothetical protein
MRAPWYALSRLVEFKMANNTIHVKVVPPDEAEKQAAVDKTTRLRALRLAKEAAARSVASRATSAPG